MRGRRGKRGAKVKRGKVDIGMNKAFAFVRHNDYNGRIEFNSILHSL